jgi:signal transduction histidine kinase
MTNSPEERILVCGPYGRDGALIVQVLCRNGFFAESCPSVETLCDAIPEGVGAIVLTEEALVDGSIDLLKDVLSRQAPWSDLPVLLLSSRENSRSEVAQELLSRLGKRINLSLLERPLNSITLVSTVQVALRARTRQYEIRSFHQELEAQVAKRTEELIAKNLELEGFTYSVSHDMRTPLRAMVAHATIILQEQGDRLDEDGREGLERLSAAALKMAHLVDDLLKYARLGAIDLRTETVDLKELAREEAARIQAERQECEFDLTFCGNLTANCDPRLVGMVLANLLDNACKYRKKNATVVKIKVGAQDLGSEHAFYVADCGIGFEMQYVGKLFRAFERLHRDEEYVGTGIGLANVRRAVERHGGRVWAESEPGRGATFWFTLAPPSSGHKPPEPAAALCQTTT